MSGQFHRQSLRFREYDHSRVGNYFVTICTFYKDHLFGEIIDDKMILNDTGKFVYKCWFDIPKHFPDAKLGAFVVMPNHVHGIIKIQNKNNVGIQNFESRNNDFMDYDFENGKNIVSENVGVQNFEPLHYQMKNQNNIEPFKKLNIKQNEYQHIIPKSLGSIIRGFKIGVTKWFRQNTKIHTVWQRNYYEHIIRDKKEYFTIRNYIRTNPKNWKDDRYY